MQRAKTYSLVADDLLVISHGDHTFVSIIKDALNEFSESSGLKQNIGKNTMLFGSVDAGEKQRILDILPFNIESETSLIGLLLPKATVKEINSLLKGFLWCHGKSCKGRAKVAWSVCFPKSKAGLVLTLHDGKIDTLKWRNKNGKSIVFTVKEIWKDLKKELPGVNWWKTERNDIIFSQAKKSYQIVLQSITENIRLHLMSLSVEKYANTTRVAELWDIEFQYKNLSAGLGVWDIAVM
ncbi:RNA-directed DNA polymerase, eukaryota, reverse transcriptase zinc-binding domain protein [Tanacetum coccineum]